MLVCVFMDGADLGHHYHADKKQYRQRDQACGGAGPFNDNDECEYNQRLSAQMRGQYYRAKTMH